MVSQIRHRRTSNPATPFTNPLEPGEIAVNTANRQIAIGDAAAGSLGNPLPAIAVRFFDARAQYAAGDMAAQAGIIYRAKAAIPPGSFDASLWDIIAGAVAPGMYVSINGDTMLGPLILSGDPTALLGAVTKQYVDAKIAAIPQAPTVWQVDTNGDAIIKFGASIVVRIKPSGLILTKDDVEVFSVSV